MKTIWKFPLRVTDAQIIHMPIGAQVLTAQVQHGYLVLWAIVDPDALMERHAFVIYGTGHDLPEDSGRYIATFQLHDGKFVGHLFEVTEP